MCYFEESTGFRALPGECDGTVSSSSVGGGSGSSSSSINGKSNTQIGTRR
jgi:hypothetical protein